MPLGGGQPLPDQLDILLRRRYALLRLLLESVKDIDPACEFHRVDRPVGARIMPVDNLHHLRAAKALQRLGGRIGFALLRRVQRLADVPEDLLREGFQILPAGAYPDYRSGITFHYTSIR